MSQASERDLFARSLSGDWQSRIGLYKKFIHGNVRVRRLGARYPNLDDFLHDCFTNLLRASHTFTTSRRLAERVETVAAWTALERERLKEASSPGAPILVRMCAAVEGEEADSDTRPAPTPYHPPKSGPEDSLSSRISAIVGAPQYMLARALATENASWENAAAAVGKPISQIRPLVVRTVDRLVRYFGAPPALNDDLEPVFSDVSAEEAATRHSDPLKPRGRVITMQLDPAFYSVTPAMRRIGLTVPADVRTITLWDAARSSAPPDEALRQHLDKCNYCAEVLRAILRLQPALVSGASTDFLFCPGASTLLQDPDEASEDFHVHLEACALCREERTRALWSHGQAAANEPVATSRSTSGMKNARVAVAVVILGALLFGGYRFFSNRNQAASQAEQPAAAEPPVAISSKYAALVEPVLMDDQRALATALPNNQLYFIEARDDLRAGKTLDAMSVAQRLAVRDHDPGAQMLYAACLFTYSQSDGYRAMLKAEAMPPRNSFRCWAMLQSALMVGNRAIAEREIGHLSADPDFGLRAKNILTKMRAIK